MFRSERNAQSWSLDGVSAGALGHGHDKANQFFEIIFSMGLETFLAPKFLYYFCTSVHFDKLCFLL